MSKVIQVLNTFSAVLFAGVLLLVYAYLPISVDLNIKEIGSIHKQQFFTYALVIFIVSSILLRIIINYGLKGVQEKLLAWGKAIILIVNVYLALLIGFVGVWNNQTHINASDYAYLNFMGPIMLIIWIGGLIYFAIKK